MAALKSLGFEEYIAEVQEVFDDHSKQLKVSTVVKKHSLFWLTSSPSLSPSLSLHY